MIRGVLISVLFLTALPVGAEVLCRSEVSYKWKKSDQDESTIHFSNVKKSGPAEPAAKEALQEAVVQDKVKAREACKELHENLSGCLASKFSSVSNTIRSLDFGVRKQLLDAVDSDCKGQDGRCLEIISSDPVCQEIVKPGADGADKKDEKGKGKKK